MPFHSSVPDSEELADSIHLGLKPTRAGPDAVVFQPHKRTNGPADMVALGARTPRLASLHPTKLFEPAMIRFDHPDFARRALALL